MAIGRPRRPSAFLKSLKLLADTTDTPQVLKKAFSALMRGVEAALEAVGTKSPTVIALGGHPETHILGETFYSQAPLRWSDDKVRRLDDGLVVSPWHGLAAHRPSARSCGRAAPSIRNRPDSGPPITAARSESLFERDRLIVMQRFG